MWGELVGLSRQQRITEATHLVANDEPAVGVDAERLVDLRPETGAPLQFDLPAVHLVADEGVRPVKDARSVVRVAENVDGVARRRLNPPDGG